MVVDPVFIFVYNEWIHVYNAWFPNLVTQLTGS